MRRLTVTSSVLAAVLAAMMMVSACAQAQPAPARAVDAPAGTSAGSTAGGTAVGAPTLVVFITIDQLRGDYLARYDVQLTGGLHRLTTGGAVFANGFHDHAITETAPGHAATMSGRFPVHTGIVMNSQGVNTRDYPLLFQANGPGAAPYRFIGTTLTDWLVASDKRTKVLSVSRKDRGAILPIGRSKQSVFWYSNDGEFTTSTWYADTLPQWVVKFNGAQVPQKSAGRAWNLLRPAGDYPEPDDVPIESRGRDFVFPHLMPTDSVVAAATYVAFPWMDSLTLAFAMRGLDEMRLGVGPQVDLLAISLSTTDAVGHRFGPDSRELHDQILRLDRYLGAFLDSLFKVRDSTRIIIALTGDHGVTPMPGIHLYDPNQSGRVVSLDSLNQRLRAGLLAVGVEPAKAVSFDDGVLVVDRAYLRGTKVNADSLVSWFATEAKKVPGVWRADRLKDLAKADTVADDIARRWLHMFEPLTTNVALVVTLEKWSVWSLAGIAMHGSPHDNDASVPVLFWGPMFRARHLPDVVRVVDMAPTLAEALGIKPLEQVDGRVLKRAFK